MGPSQGLHTGLLGPQQGGGRKHGSCALRPFDHKCEISPRGSGTQSHPQLETRMEEREKDMEEGEEGGRRRGREEG